MDNLIDIPELNPVIFYKVNRANLPQYYTKHFEDWMFHERINFWQTRTDYVQVWQTTDIVYLQFESQFDPIVVKLMNKYGQVIITQISLVKLPNKLRPGWFSYEIGMSLAGVPTGCYYFQLEAGAGAELIMISDKQFISSTQIPNTMRFEYWHTRFFKDVMFETGIQFQIRVLGSFGFMGKDINNTFYRDERWNPAILNSKGAKQWPITLGGTFGIPDDIFNIISEAFTCQNVLVDGKPMCISEGAKFEFFPVDRYPKRGVTFLVENGINRNSRRYAIAADTTKKIVAVACVDAKAWGDTSNQGSTNSVPVITEE